MMKNNGLELIKINSEVIYFSNIENVEKVISENITMKSFVVAYMDYAVMTGRYKNGNFIFYNNETLEQKYIQRIRVFNETEELLIWRSSNGFKGRLRIDSLGEDIEAVEAHQVLFGTRKKSLGDFTEIYEDRGTKIILPFSDLTVDKDKRIFIKTRNYIDYNEVCQATCVDARFVSFTNGKNDLE